MRMPLARSITLRSSSARARALELVRRRAKALKREMQRSRMFLHALLLQPADDVGGDAGIDRGLDRGRVALVDEHGDRPLAPRG